MRYQSLTTRDVSRCFRYFQSGTTVHKSDCHLNSGFRRYNMLGEGVAVDYQLRPQGDEKCCVHPNSAGTRGALVSGVDGRIGTLLTRG
ncbi:hypothetical protein OUZ56_028091 [Daphnia magna]|uniref:Uncharacterized protein n=1 Tax=Daphnia magna TaxID=35525 RepID=A0ABR0B2U0_9CRUS|nr:hypothetical protein OUZ56_028091 [Daphnia magna]